MVGKLFFRTKKLLSLLSFGVIFFVAMEIWLSHKKVDSPSSGYQKSGVSPSVDSEFDYEEKRKHKLHSNKDEADYEFYGVTLDVGNKTSKMPGHKDELPNQRRKTEADYERDSPVMDGNYKNRTDFRGGGEEENDGGGDDDDLKQRGNDEFQRNDPKQEEAIDDGDMETVEKGAIDGVDVKMNVGYNNEEINLEVQGTSGHIPCHINDDFTIPCLKEGREVYVPFSFIKKYFEIYGELVRNKSGMEELYWRHSYAKVYEFNLHSEGGKRRRKWIGEYEHDGVFMSFEHYRVEIRDRVKCVSAKEGVPVSKQWGAQGYFYPIQIAQFGLSHYSKMLIEPERKFQALGTSKSDWLYFDYAGRLGGSEEVLNGEKATIEVITRPTDDPNISKSLGGVEVVVNVSNILDPNAFYYVNIPKDIPASGISPFSDTNFHFLSFDIKFVKNASVSVTFETNIGGVYTIHYLASNVTLYIDEQDIYYGIGLDPGWHRLTRDIDIDFRKSLPQKLRKKLSLRMFPLHLSRVELRGIGRIRDLQLADKDHLNLFYHSANWLVKYQDSKGGWPIPVGRVLVEGEMSLEPGWYSAMAQGHAMSLLSRAYCRSRNPIYLRSAYQAINPFLLTSIEGGVLAYLFDRYPWYEEYPTTPPSYVINGFMYALFGLYDLAKTLETFDITSDDVILEDGFALNDDIWSKKFDGSLNFNDTSTLGEFSNLFETTNVHSLEHRQLHTRMNKRSVKNSESNLLRKNMDLNSTTVVAQSFQNEKLSFKHSRRNTTKLKIKKVKLQQKSQDLQDANTERSLTLHGKNMEPLSVEKLPSNGDSSPTDVQNISSNFPKNEDNLSLHVPTYESIHPPPPGNDQQLDRRPRVRRESNEMLHQSSIAQLNPEFSILKVKDAKTARFLFEAGLKTLKIALPLFDTGSGSFYDLRHFSLPGCPPNRARWDYHSTHISQLLMASLIDEDPVGKEFFHKTITRWYSYMKGKRAPHN